MAGDSDNIRTERMPWKFFRCGYEGHLIKKHPNQPKENEKWRNQVRFNEKGNRSCSNYENKIDQKDICIYGTYVR